MEKNGIKMENKETPIQKCLKLIKQMRDKAIKEDAYHGFLAMEYCYLTLQNHLIDEDHFYYNESDLIYAITQAYIHGRDEQDDVLHNHIDASVKVIMLELKNRKVVK